MCCFTSGVYEVYNKKRKINKPEDRRKHQKMQEVGSFYICTSSLLGMCPAPCLTSFQRDGPRTPQAVQPEESEE